MSGKRGRSRGFSMSNEHRVKIQNSNILNALIEHAEGKRKMSATQVTAGLGLLKKALPDLSATDITVNDERRDASEFTDAELLAVIAERRSARASGQAAGEDESDTLH